MRQRPGFYAPDDRPSFNTTPRPMLVESCVERDQLGETEMHQHASLEQEWGHRYHVSRMDFFYPNGWNKGNWWPISAGIPWNNLGKDWPIHQMATSKPRKIVMLGPLVPVALERLCLSSFFFIFAKPERIWMQSIVFDLPGPDLISEVQGGTSCVCDLR